MLEQTSNPARVETCSELMFYSLSLFRENMQLSSQSKHVDLQRCAWYIVLVKVESENAFNGALETKKVDLDVLNLHTTGGSLVSPSVAVFNFFEFCPVEARSLPWIQGEQVNE